ncbi:alpha/beta hydrolase [Streptomyces lydicamycinicus]|uniref:alpha/beta fold hydrolase n=1 Tax=Streptomyces lydicamycinicus TaxID=1546107 RepID=UPI002035E022|nr:alpha/beta hydrolase [Streptomyces lydicamycinicus]USA01472.1 alpha/beta hydrolase [Streptomyces lydicamycinicus]
MTKSAGEDLVCVAADGVELAVRDHGGDGSPVLLLHGAGRTLADWARVAPLLAERHRVWAMDLRGHGRSGDGAAPWTFEVAADDVTAVLAACGAPDAVVVGHSLGGMIAARCLERDGGVPAAVNLDGHGMGRPEQYVGLDAATVRERLGEVRKFAEEAGGRPFPPEALDAVLGYQTGMAAELGIPAELMEAGVRRSLGETADGQLFLRPGRRQARETQQAMAGIDLFTLYRRVTRPLLIARALRPNPSVPGMPPWFDGMMAAYVRGLARDLAELARTRPQVTVAGVDGTHAMLLERPEDVAGLVSGFVRGLPGRP